VFGLFVHRIDGFHDVIPVKKDSEPHYLLMIPNALSDSLEKPKILWLLFINLGSEIVIGK
jgi:hypothetical protein